MDIHNCTEFTNIQLIIFKITPNIIYKKDYFGHTLVPIILSSLAVIIYFIIKSMLRNQEEPEINSTNSRSRADIQLWCRRINEIQRDRVSPEVLSRIQQTFVQNTRAVNSCRDARYLERTNICSAFSHVATLQDFSSAQTTDMLETSSGLHAHRSATLRDNLQFLRARREMPGRTLALDALEQEAAESTLSRLEAEVQQATPSIFAFNAGNDEAAIPERITAQVDALLDSLKVEPSNEVELIAKFKVFENILSTVTEIRQETIAFWEANQDQFVGASKTSCSKDIKAIDSNDAMGLTEYESRGGHWFVYYMSRKANQNSAAIAKVLAKIRSKLEILAQELGECPCCLDKLSAESCTTLGCCHRVCTECWDHWRELKQAMGATPFCPLCKHEEFVTEIFHNFTP